MTSLSVVTPELCSKFWANSSLLFPSKLGVLTRVSSFQFREVRKKGVVMTSDCVAGDVLRIVADILDMIFED